MQETEEIQISFWIEFDISFSKCQVFYNSLDMLHYILFSKVMENIIFWEKLVICSEVIPGLDGVPITYHLPKSQLCK